MLAILAQVVVVIQWDFASNTDLYNSEWPLTPEVYALICMKTYLLLASALVALFAAGEHCSPIKNEIGALLVNVLRSMKRDSR